VQKKRSRGARWRENAGVSPPRGQKKTRCSESVPGRGGMKKKRGLRRGGGKRMCALRSGRARKTGFIHIRADVAVDEGSQNKATNRNEGKGELGITHEH